MSSGANSPDPLIQIKNLSTGYASKVVLKDVNFDVPAHGIMGLMGPSGGGKSTLLRAVTHWNDSVPSFWVNGEVYLHGEEILRNKQGGLIHEEIKLLPQKARLYTGSVLDNVIDLKIRYNPLTLEEKQQGAQHILEPMGLWDELKPILDQPVLSLSIGRHKMIILARLVAENARCLFLDEPLRDIAIAEEEEFIDLIRKAAQKLSVVMVTHNKKDARMICDTICFMTGGQVIEVADCEEFFTNPKTELGQEYLLTGSAWPTEESKLPPIPKKHAPKIPKQIKKVAPPREFHWIMRDLLAGTEYPGLLRDEELDLHALSQLGVQILVNLTETPYKGKGLSEYNIRGEFFPIVDMGIPSFEDAFTFCGQVSGWIDQATTTVVHCKAGLGRTGTMLACVLVYRGMTASGAIDKVRMTNPYYIQSDIQFQFIGEFEEHARKSQDGN